MKRCAVLCCALLLVCSLTACSKSAPAPKEKPAIKYGVPAADEARIAALKEAKPVEGPFFDMTFEEAQIKADAEKKAIMIDFYMIPCGPCKTLDKRTWPDTTVMAWLAEHAVSLKINGPEEKTLIARYGASGYPTIVFFQPDGKELGRLKGFVPPEKFLPEAAKILGVEPPAYVPTSQATDEATPEIGETVTEADADESEEHP